MAIAESFGVEGRGSWGGGDRGQDVFLIVGTWAGLNGGVVPPPHPYLRGVSKPKATGRG